MNPKLSSVLLNISASLAWGQNVGDAGALGRREGEYGRDTGTEKKGRSVREIGVRERHFVGYMIIKGKEGGGVGRECGK
ncbi:hypothetical protein XELAEV_18036603mg [Xenopus laevis]|uniref:Secreted protein n=1 Tax=Xenopus laevis TaxID=8355 RepID=A0A974H9F0_XENLA|nr:hypothetical protein XELAEV_18036603mg [Xenopus laevis]